MDARVERSATAPGDVLAKVEVAAPDRGWFELSPLNKRRLRTFKANRRGYYSFIMFTTLFVITLFAEFIANDKPFLVKYDGAYYTPIFKMYTEKQFGGEFGGGPLAHDAAATEDDAARRDAQGLTRPLLGQHDRHAVCRHRREALQQVGIRCVMAVCKVIAESGRSLAATRLRTGSPDELMVRSIFCG